MSTSVLVLVEGQTEERFVKDVLAPAFWDRDVFFVPTILNTKVVKDGPNFKGGVTSFSKFRADMAKLLNGVGPGLATTMLDYYGLPLDFPGMKTRPANASPLERAKHVERAIHKHFGSPKNFVPFLALHEFEAWLFSAPEVLPAVMARRDLEPQFAAIRHGFGSPEEINERPTHAPSKRIEKLFPEFRKTLHGPNAAARIGLDRIKLECPHFEEWLLAIEAAA